MTKSSVCGAYDELGHEMVSPHPLSNSIIFRKARELADQASNYKDSAAVQAEADGLRRIGKSDSTSPTELLNSTTALAALCGHPLGIGTTSG